MRCGWCHQYVVWAPLEVLERRIPLPHTEIPRGTVIRRSYVALSEGALFDGNQDIEPTGSPTTNAPSDVRTKPSVDPSASVSALGTPT